MKQLWKRMLLVFLLCIPFFLIGCEYSQQDEDQAQGAATQVKRSVYRAERIAAFLNEKAEAANATPELKKAAEDVTLAVGRARVDAALAISYVGKVKAGESSFLESHLLDAMNRVNDVIKENDLINDILESLKLDDDAIASLNSFLDKKSEAGLAADQARLVADRAENIATFLKGLAAAADATPELKKASREVGESADSARTFALSAISGADDFDFYGGNSNQYLSQALSERKLANQELNRINAILTALKLDDATIAKLNSFLEASDRRRDKVDLLNTNKDTVDLSNIGKEELKTLPTLEKTQANKKANDLANKANKVLAAAEETVNKANETLAAATAAAEQATAKLAKTTADYNNAEAKLNDINGKLTKVVVGSDEEKKLLIQQFHAQQNVNYAKIANNKARDVKAKADAKKTDAEAAKSKADQDAAAAKIAADAANQTAADIRAGTATASAADAHHTTLDNLGAKFIEQQAVIDGIVASQQEGAADASEGCFLSGGSPC